MGNTPLVRLRHLPEKVKAGNNNTILVKLEGSNPTGSSSARVAFYMLKKAQERGALAPGATILSATSGNMGLALASAAASQGYKLIVVMPEDATFVNSFFLHQLTCRQG